MGEQRGHVAEEHGADLEHAFVPSVHVELLQQPARIDPARCQTMRWPACQPDLQLSTKARARCSAGTKSSRLTDAEQLQHAQVQHVEGADRRLRPMLKRACSMFVVITGRRVANSISCERRRCGAGPALLGDGACARHQAVEHHVEEWPRSLPSAPSGTRPSRPPASAMFSARSTSGPISASTRLRHVHVADLATFDARMRSPRPASGSKARAPRPRRTGRSPANCGTSDVINLMIAEARVAPMRGHQSTKSWSRATPTCRPRNARASVRPR